LDEDACGICLSDRLADACTSADEGGSFVSGHGDCVEVCEDNEDEVLGLSEGEPTIAAVLGKGGGGVSCGRYSNGRSILLGDLEAKAILNLQFLPRLAH
jgi:hypothetical protein